MAYAKAMTGDRWTNFNTLMTVVILVIVAGACEVIALTAIAFGEGSTVEATLVFAAIALCLMLVAIELAEPVLAEDSHSARSTATSVLGAGSLAALLYFIVRVTL